MPTTELAPERVLSEFWFSVPAAEVGIARLDLSAFWRLLLTYRKREDRDSNMQDDLQSFSFSTPHRPSWPATRLDSHFRPFSIFSNSAFQLQ